MKCYKCNVTIPEDTLIRHYIDKQWRDVCIECKMELLRKMYPFISFQKT